jgi:repressor LexA
MENKQPLTKKQNDLLHYLIKYNAENGYPPTLKEVADNFKMKSRNGAEEVLQVLERKGYIERKLKGRSRAIRIIENENKGNINTKPDNELPVIRAVILGKGSAENYLNCFINNEGVIYLDKYLYNVGSAFCAIAKDDSMKSDGILIGDFVIGKQSRKINDKSKVIAIVHNEIIIRNYEDLNENEFTLSSKEKQYPKITTSYDDASIVIIGEVIGVIRKG